MTVDDRPVLNQEEIEITPQMIEAGEAALFFAVSPEDVRYLEPSDLVRAIYESMAVRSSSAASSTSDSGLKSSGSAER